ncbi:MAG TPA: hypothetical protein VFA11_05990 [Acidimicrobiales bacterium]|nr:hypothetical protein [Acidimicrobiales bacterium]
MTRWGMERTAWDRDVSPYGRERSLVATMGRAAVAGVFAVVAVVMLWHLVGFLFGAVVFAAHVVVVLAVLAAIGWVIHKLL